MNFKDLLATANIRQTDIHLAIEATGAQQGLIEHIGTIRCRDNNNAVVCFEAVHFNQQLV